MKSRVVTSIRLAIESLLDRLRENSLFRSISRRYGRRYWQLPRLLRRRLYFEASASSLPGARTWKFGRGEMVEAAAGIAKIDTPLDEQRMVARPFKTRPPAVTRLDEAWLVGKYAAPITPRGRLILSAFRDEPGILGLETHPDIEAWLLTPDAAKAELPELEHVWPMVNRLQGNYYHWLIEWCGRLEQIEAYGAQVGNLPRLLIPEKGPDYIRASLKLLGFAPETWIPWSESSAPRKIHGLVLPSFRGSSLGASPASLQWLRRRFLGAAGSKAAEPHRKIYIPRGQGGWRCVLNDEEVSAWFLSEGYEVWQPHLFPLAEQIRRFSEASLIVGLHGAALTNILFAPGARLIELLGDYGDGVYFNMAERMRQPYEALFCKSVGDDVVVDLEALKLSVGRQARQGARSQRNLEHASYGT